MVFLSCLPVQRVIEEPKTTEFNKDVLKLIFYYVQDPATVSLVCKRWKKLSDELLGYEYYGLIKKIESVARKNKTITNAQHYRALLNDQQKELIYFYEKSVSFTYRWFGWGDQATEEKKFDPYLLFKVLSAKEFMRREKWLEDENLIRFSLRLSSFGVQVPTRYTHEKVATLTRKTLKESVKSLNDVRMLYLKNCDLTRIPPEIGSIKSLITLDISGNNLSALPNSILQLKEVVAIVANCNKIHTIPKDWSPLYRLMKLDLSYNELSEVPASIGNLKMLMDLDLSYNKIEELPSTLWQLVNLQKLNVYSNQLSELSEEIGNCTLLWYLHIGYNKIKRLPDSVKNLNLAEKSFYPNLFENKEIPDSVYIFYDDVMVL